MFLVIDTTNDKALVGLADKMSVFSFGEWPNGNDLSQKIQIEIDKLTGKVDKDIEAVFCVTGPGSFTGIRVGVATANAIGYAKQVPVVAVTRFEIYEELNPVTKKSKVVVLDNIQDLVYAKVCLANDCEYFAGTIDGLAAMVAEHDVSILGEYLSLGSNSLSGELVGDGKKVYSDVRLNLITKIGYRVLKKERLNGFSLPVTPLYINKPNITKPKK